MQGRGANPESVTIVLASTRLDAPGIGLGGMGDLRQPHHRVALPTGRSTRNGVTSLMAWPGPVESSCSSAYTDSGASARTVAVDETASPRDISQLPSAPVTTASTTSLMSQS